MTPKEKAEELIEMHKCLSLGDTKSYALVYCDCGSDFEDYEFSGIEFIKDETN